jgi:hypothetical protein
VSTTGHSSYTICYPVLTLFIYSLLVTLPPQVLCLHRSQTTPVMARAPTRAPSLTPLLPPNQCLIPVRLIIMLTP